ncbi:S-layer homology domain-containing protein [Intestinimonas sp. MSJ-38]|uniref:S-layer homology domain-containing protein n=1 Tax=Intestinimonas sp. MSJ-38 TaxID=2841532 RepID=UPI001C120E28|nr:S-layer homology domain-containing protein [Intestinimonas sp. MSJ-38]MBU5433269.1 S-layer homology domain-containing protein [Intestinimonas sp. MSJ-38]
MRKRITSLFLVLALCLTLLPTAALAEEASSAAQETQDSTEVGDGCTIGEDTAVQTGTGAAATGEVVKISTRDDLKAFRERVNKGESSLNAVLVKDVSYTSSTNVAWEAIKNYTGTFDGNGHMITLGLGNRYQSLFNSIASGGTVQDLTIQINNWGVSVSTETGSIAYSNNGTIQRCQALDWTGEKNIGGIVYQNESTGLVKDCRVGTLTLRKSRENLVGGIAFINHGRIQDCYVSGKLQSTASGTRTDLSSATAIVRTNSGTVENCYYWQYDSESAVAAVAGTPVTDKRAFASGEVAYKLNGKKTELDSAWRQNLPGNKDGAAVDELPVTDASHGRVYYDTSYYSLVPHLHGEKELTAWQKTDSLPDTSGSYYLTGDVTLASGQTLGNNVTLCVNGHSVTGDMTVTGSFTLTDCGSGSVIGNVTVNGGGSFALEGCALSGGIENNGTLTVTDGTVTAAGGIGVDNKGTFTMNSGTITAASGTGVANNGTLTMNGGTVTGCDKGIEGSGGITVSGKVKISGNANGNLILPDGKTVSVGTLDSMANIGITAEKQSELTAGGSIRLTSGGAAYTTRFFADNAAAYAIFANGEDLVMRTLGEHTHCICGHPADGAGNIGDHTTHADVTFQPWTSGNSLPTTGNYYLTQNVVVDKMTVLTGTLCLNGYTISAEDGGCPVEVSTGELNLTDCAAELGSVIAAKNQAIDVYSKANIFNGVIRGGSGAGISIGLYSARANVAIYGGKITGSGTGAAVNNGEIHMYGGEIFKNSRGVQAGAINREKRSSSGSFYLHGGKITDNHGDQGGGVYVEHNFYMDGGEVSNNSATGNGGGIYMHTGSIFLSGGKVTGNRAGGDGGGVCTKAYRDDKSSVELSGNAEISGNHAGGRGGGVYLDVYSDFGTNYLDPSNSCNLIMDGGSITGNTSVGDGGGVYAAAEDKRDAKSYVNVKGSAQITGNKKGEEDNNLYLPNYSGGVTIGGDLDQTADIRVTTENKPGKNSTVTIAKKSWQVSSVTVPNGVFKVDGADGKISVDDNGTVTLAPCSHSWTTYTASGAVITAKCSICSANGGSVTINKPAHTTYGDGNEAAATVTGSIPGVTAPTITYTKGGTPLEAAPTDAGTYTASITLGEGGNAKTASVVYTIAKATPTASDFTFAAPAGLTYDGNAKTATVTSSKSGMGAVTVKYYQDDKPVEKPTNAGKYTVKISVKEGTNYKAAAGLTVGTLVINKIDYPGTMTFAETVRSGKVTNNKILTLPPLPDGANYGSPTVAGTTPALISAQSVSGTTLTYSTTDQTDGTEATITIPVTGATNYNDYSIVVTVTAKDKEDAGVSITTPPTSKTYGEADFTLTATKTAPDSGTWSWVSSDDTILEIVSGAATATPTIKVKKADVNGATLTVTYESDTRMGSASATITVARKEVTISGITANNKEYDGNTSATVNASGATITGKVDGDDLTVSVATGSTFDRADAGSRTVTLGTLTLNGTSAGNYTLATSGNQTTAAANITVRDLTVKPNSGQSKSYGTTPDPVLAYTSTGTVTGETAAFDGALSREAGEDVGQYDITKGSLELKDSGTFKAANYNLVLDTEVVTFEITKVTYGGSAPTKTVNILKNYAGVQTGRLTAADFFTTAPAEAKITNAVPNSNTSNMMSIAGADLSGNFTYDSKTNITAASDESWTVTISSKNYTDITGTLTFKLVDKTDVSAQITFPNGALTYNGAGQKYEKATISGVSGGTWNYTYAANSGTGASLDSAGLPKTAGTYTVTAKYEDDAHIGIKSATLTVSKATPTGAPTCTKITTSGKTLADAPLAIGTIAPAGGTLAWDMAANTVVAANTAYGWTYTPADTANYKALTGSLTPYAVSSGGGGGSAATPSVSDRIARELKNAKEGSTVTIDMKGETKIPASTTKEIAGKDVTVELDMGGGMVWSFNGLDVPKGGVSLNLGVKTGTKTIPAKVINALTGETTTIQLQLDHNGPFGMSLKLSVDLDKKHDGLYANLYFYNLKSGELEFQSAGLISGGKASWVFDHASDYAIVIDKESHEPMTFTDVPDTAYYAEAVNWAVAKKITGGVGNDLFAPNAPCTRAQIVTFLWRAAGSPGSKTMSGFSDVPADSYYAKAVAWAVENGITGGTGDGKFSPNAACTRAQAVTFLYRASGAPAVSGNAAFGDVAANAYYAAAVKWAEKNGITGGIGGGLFGSDNNCTRAQIVTFLYRSYQSK